MQVPNDTSDGKTFFIIDPSLLNKNQTLKQQPEIDRIRKRLINLITTLLLFCFTDFIFTLYKYGTNYSLEGQSIKTISQTVSILLSMIYYGFGLLVTYQYYGTGLLVFAWTGFLSLITFVTIIVIGLIFVITTASGGGAEIIVAIILMIIVCLIAFVLQFFTVRYAFILSKLLKKAKSLTTERV